MKNNMFKPIIILILLFGLSSCSTTKPIPIQVDEEAEYYLANNTNNK